MVLFFNGSQYAQTAKYPELSKSIEIFRGDSAKWDEANTHTLTVMELNRDGYKYWGYYGLNHYGNFAHLRHCGLVRSNDLVHWVKYEGNPIIKGNVRWPTGVVINKVVYLFYAEYDENNDSHIVMVSSKDGIHFGEKQEVVAYEKGKQNQNPFIFYNEKDKNYYLTYYSGIEKAEPGLNKWGIALIHAKNVKDLCKAKPKILMSAPTIIAAPSLAYYNNKYYLLIEAKTDGKWDNKWVTLGYESKKIEGPYTELANNPVLGDNDACAFEYVLNKQLYIFYSHAINAAETDWILKMVKVVK